MEATSFFQPVGLECQCHIFCSLRVDWLSLRGTTTPARTFLPILEVLTCSRCSSSRHNSSGERSAARQSLRARFSGDRTTRVCARWQESEKH